MAAVTRRCKRKAVKLVKCEDFEESVVAMGKQKNVSDSD